MLAELKLKDKFNAGLMWIIQWRENHIKEKTFLLILAFIIGIFSGFAALLLKLLISAIASMLSTHLTISGANYLCRVFRKATGMTPAAWRANRSDLIRLS